MQLYYYRDPIGNFGDDLNAVLWPRLLGPLLDHDSAHLLLAIGTILSVKLPKAARYTVFGSGTGYSPPPSIDERWDVRFVRGPLTAKLLGLPATKGITDPALLVRRLAAPLPASKRRGMVFIPHHGTAIATDWSELCARAGLTYVEPSDPPLMVNRAISRASLVITEAMHGAILADAMRTPWVGIRSGPQINELKWQDWLHTVELPFQLLEFPTLPPSAKLPLKRRLKLSVYRSLRARRPRWHHGSLGEAVDTRYSSRQEALDALLLIRDRAPSIARLSNDDVCDRNLSRLNDEVASLLSARRARR
jgi:hypothetical protein